MLREYNEKPEYLFPMGDEILPKQFIFNEKLDSDYLFSLYADDYAYVEEIFDTTLRHFDGDFDAIQLAYDTGNLPDLKKAVHKIKPTFGFIGMPAIQDLCKNFEDNCAAAQSKSELTDQYKTMNQSLLDAKAIIEKDLTRLKEYNANLL
jgi:HPt (histidine-containing phosphotransfer) domain-containing protein